MNNQSNTVLFAFHRFQKRIQTVSNLLSDIIARLHCSEFQADTFVQFESQYESTSSAYFKDYCQFVFQWLLDHAPQMQSALSVTNLVILYWKEKNKLTELTTEEITILFSVVVALQDKRKSEAFLVDELRSVYASRLYSERKIEEAVAIQRSVVSLRKRSLGTQHIATAEAAFLLANIFKYKGFLEQAIQYYQLALKGFESNLGSRAEKTKLCMTKIARCHEVLGELSYATQYLQRLLAINESQYGKQHILTIASMKRLATCLLEQKQYLPADVLFQKLHHICLEEFGPSHTYSISSVAALGKCRVGMKQYDSAQSLFREVLEAIHNDERFHESEQVGVLVNLAMCYSEQGYNEKANSCFIRALKYCEQYLGADHEDTFRCVNSMASFYERQANYTKAEEMYLYCLAITEGCHRYHIARLADIRARLAIIYRRKNEFGMAELVLKGAIRQLDARAIDDADIKANLFESYASCLNEQGKHQDAFPYLTQLVKSSIERYGPKHPESAASMESLLSTIKAMIDSKRQAHHRTKLKELCQKSVRECLTSLGSIEPRIGDYLTRLQKDVV